jgi:hypothetical protein
MGCFSLSLSGAVLAGEPQIMAALSKLRAVSAGKDAADNERLSQEMDRAWDALTKEREAALPIVARELRSELAKPEPDQFFALDTAFFLVASVDPEAESKGSLDLALAALGRIDPAAEIIQHNQLELVRFTHALAKTGGARALPQIDRIFLPFDGAIEYFEAPHYVKLPPHAVRVLLYGATGAAVEDHIAGLLDSKDCGVKQRTLLALLVDLGSERSVPAVSAVMNRCGSNDVFTMAVTALMTVGGPAGRDAVVAARPETLDEKSRAYHQRILPAVKAVAYEKLREKLKTLDSGDHKFSDAELKERLEKYAQTGVDSEIDPGNLLDSRIPRAELLSYLKQIRSRALWKLNQHSIEDAHITNQIINALQYRAD